MSGLSRTPGKRVGANNPPRVRIPILPPSGVPDRRRDQASRHPTQSARRPPARGERVGAPTPRPKPAFETRALRSECFDHKHFMQLTSDQASAIVSPGSKTLGADLGAGVKLHFSRMDAWRCGGEVELMMVKAQVAVAIGQRRVARTFCIPAASSVWSASRFVTP